MGFLVKGAFWFSVVLLSLPLLDGGESETGPAGDFEMGETISALGVAIDDIRDICLRHPDVCVTGTETLTALGHRARDGARIAHQYLDAALGETEAGSDPLATGTVSASTKAAEPAAALAEAPLVTETVQPLPVQPYTAPSPAAQPL